MPKPKLPASKRRSEMITIRLTKKELRDIKAKAKGKKLDVAKWVRLKCC